MTHSFQVTRDYFVSTKVVEPAQRALESFLREKYEALTDAEKHSLNNECDRVIRSLKARCETALISREQIRYAAVCAIYYTTFGESPLITAVNEAFRK